MRFLLDTHVLIWALSNPNRLRQDVRLDIGSRRNEVYFSAASIWEVAIKATLRRPGFAFDPVELIVEAADIGFIEMAVTAHVAASVKNLPLLHHDPFDRLLVAQAIAEPAVLLTADGKLQAYSDLVRLV